MAKLRWSPQAADDLAQICEFIARDSEPYARLFAQQTMRILKAMARERLPGASVPEYGREDIRERLLHSYRLIVRVHSQQRVLEVVRIIHGARLLLPLQN